MLNVVTQADSSRPWPELATFSHGTEKALGEFFARAGQYVSGSNFGAMLEVMDRAAHYSDTCDVCGGTGCRDISPEDMAKRARRLEAERDPERLRLLRKDIVKESCCFTCHGRGRLEPSRQGHEQAGAETRTTAPCPRCHGTAFNRYTAPDRRHIKAMVKEVVEVFPEVTVEDLVACARNVCEALSHVPAKVMKRWPCTVSAIRLYANACEVQSMRGVESTIDLKKAIIELRLLMRDHCVRCNGEGCIVPVTVRETGESVETGGAPEIDESEVQKHGELARAFIMLQEQLWDDAVGLETYYGPEGNRWGSTDHRREFALWPLTHWGQQLVKDARRRSHELNPLLNPENLDACELLAEEKADEARASETNFRRRNMLDMCDTSARGVLTRSQRAWTWAILKVAGHPDADEHHPDATKIAAAKASGSRPKEVHQQLVRLTTHQEVTSATA